LDKNTYSLQKIFSLVLCKMRIVQQPITLQVSNNDFKTINKKRHGGPFPSTIRCLIVGHQTVVKPIQ
jgi:hypothetical protein